MTTEYFRVKLRQQLQVGIPVQSAVEVLSISPTQICSIPRVDTVLLGVVNWRGQLLWTLDLSDLIKIRQDPSQSMVLSKTLTMLVLKQEHPTRQVGCVVSEMMGMMELPDSQIQPPPQRIPASVRSYFSGMVLQDTPLLLLDAEKILNSTRWQTAYSA